ncbi:MAG: hypothetical protein ABSH47_19210 [Bryobacteraceae bacterium]|jgi:hypothetical protein
MSTESQILANRRNAQASTGPRTAQGKSISSANALKHGLSAGFRVLQSENQEEFDDLIAELHRTFAPTNAYESILVEEMAHSHWRLARARRLESLMVDDMFAASPCSDADAALLSALLNDRAAPFVALQRYAAAAERTGYRALKQLLALRRLDAQAARDSARQNEPNSASPGTASSSAQSPPTHGNSSDNGAPQTRAPAAAPHSGIACAVPGAFPSRRLFTKIYDGSSRSRARAARLCNGGRVEALAS